MEKTVYEYSHRGLCVSLKKDSRPENSGSTSKPSSSSSRGSHGEIKEKSKNDVSKPPVPSGETKNGDCERKKKELNKGVVRDGNDKSKKSSTAKGDFIVPNPKVPLPQSFDLEMDDDCMSTITVATGHTSKSSVPQPNSNVSTHSVKEKGSSVKNGNPDSLATSSGGSSVSKDTKKETGSSSQGDKKSKALVTANSAEARTPQPDKASIALLRHAFEKGSADWKTKVAESFKSFLQQRNKSGTGKEESTSKSVKSADKESEEPKKIDRDKLKSSKKERIETETSSCGSKKDKVRSPETSAAKSPSKLTTKHGKGSTESKKESVSPVRPESSKSRSHRHQDSSAKEEHRKSSSSTKTPSARDSSGHRQRHNSNRSSTSRNSKEKQSHETENRESRKRKATSPEPSKSPKKEKTESKDKSREKSRKNSESKSKKSRRELREISRIQKSLFDDENEDDDETSESRKHRKDKEKSRKTSSTKLADSKPRKVTTEITKKTPANGDDACVILSSDCSDLSDTNRRPATEEPSRRSSRHAASTLRAKLEAGTTSSSGESKSGVSRKPSGKRENSGKSSTVVKNKSVEVTPLSEAPSKSSNLKTTSSSPLLCTINKVPETQDEVCKSLSDVSSGCLDNCSSTKDETDHVAADRVQEICTKIIPSEAVETCKPNNVVSRELLVSEDFPVGTDISDGEVDIENLEATLQPFSQDFGYSSSADFAAIMNLSDYEDNDEDDLGKYDKPPDNSLRMCNELNNVLTDVNNFVNEDTLGYSQNLDNQTNSCHASVEQMDVQQQDFPVLSIPDPVVPVVDNSDESEEEVPLIRIRTDLFNDSGESVANGPTKVPEKQSLEPAVDNHTLQANFIVGEVRNVFNDVQIIGANLQKKLSSALDILKKQSDCLTINNLDHDLKKQYEDSLNSIRTILQVGSRELEKKIKVHSKTLAVHNDNFSVEEMQMDTAANYFAALVLTDMMLKKFLYVEFSEKLKNVRYRIMSILKVHYNQFNHVLHGETWYFHVNSIIQGKLSTSQYETWQLVASHTWALVKTFEECPAIFSPVYEHRVLGCDGFKEILDDVLLTATKKRQQTGNCASSEVDYVQELVNTIFLSATPSAPVTQAVGNQDSAVVNSTASSYLNNCSLVYSPVSVSPISPPNCTSYSGTASVATTSAPIPFRETMGNNIYSPRAMNVGMGIQQQNPSAPIPHSGQMHYRETHSQTFSMTPNYERCLSSSYSECMPMPVTNNGPAPIMTHPSQQAPGHTANNYYNSQMYGMSPSDYGHTQPQPMMNRSATLQVHQRHTSSMGVPNNMPFSPNQTSLVRPNQNSSQMQQRQQNTVAQGGNQFQGPIQNAYLSNPSDRYQSNYNAIRALSTITGNQSMLHGNPSVMDIQSGQIISHSMHPSQQSSAPMISIDSSQHYHTEPDAVCQGTKSSNTHPPEMIITRVQGSFPHHPVPTRSTSLPTQDQSSNLGLDRRSSFEGYPANGPFIRRNNVTNDCFPSHR